MTREQAHPLSTLTCVTEKNLDFCLFIYFCSFKAFSLSREKITIISLSVVVGALVEDAAAAAGDERDQFLVWKLWFAVRKFRILT